MSKKVNIENYDRRSSSRNTINGIVKFKCNDDTEFGKALIIDISQTGVLIGLDQQIGDETQVCLMLEDNSQYEGPIEIKANVVRLAKSLGDNCYTYGCKICDISGF